MIDFIFSEEQYSQLKKAYNDALFANKHHNLVDTKSLIYAAEQFCFYLPSPLRKILKNNLNTADRLLNIIIIGRAKQPTKTMPNNNPFYLINLLCTISQQLTTNAPKSPYQIIYLKANNLILNCIDEISNYFFKKTS